MPPVEECDLVDSCVVLDAVRYDRYGRIRTTDVPREIACRWVEDVTSTGQGDTAAVVAQVYVAEDLGLSSVLWHGPLADFPKDWAEDAPAELVEVSNFHKVPDLDGREFRRWCDVTRLRDALPGVAE
jgi:hypothetical protein